MANYSRNDPSSLSFGRRLAKAEHDAATARMELDQLKKDLPNSKSLQGAALAADVIKQQRQAAKHTLADSSSSLEQLNAIDPSILTPAYQEQLRLNKRDAAMREMPPSIQPFSFPTAAAQARFDNWKATTQLQDFHANNTLPGEQKPQRPFDLWKARQDSPEGKYQRHLKMQQEIKRDELIRKSEANRTKIQAEGFTLGSIRDINS